MGEAAAAIDAPLARNGDVDDREGEEKDEEDDGVAAAAAEFDPSCSAGTMALASTQRRAGDQSSTWSPPASNSCGSMCGWRDNNRRANWR